MQKTFNNCTRRFSTKLTYKLLLLTLEQVKINKYYAPASIVNLVYRFPAEYQKFIYILRTNYYTYLYKHFNGPRNSTNYYHTFIDSEYINGKESLW